ncbi:MAG: radical SAM family heme chaperone HemW [Desulfovibrio sp.]|jgi:oxygen-independent coproporphyrinogen-3 oxidase|nr:radical SAM family heme chaperone HemW [Desulfovibrio sp.]
MRLYIHVPFCSKKCAYCAFYSLPLEEGAPGEKRIAGYAASLLREVSLRGEHLGRIPVKTVFFGGGTPSLLSGTIIGDIMRMIRACFLLTDNAEISAEANPDSALNDGWLFAARAAGVNRLSFGVQSFDDAVLRLLGRPHGARAAHAAFESARMAGFTNISIDLMWGLPGPPPYAQTQVQWLRQLKLATELKPEHIAAYGFTLEPASPLEKMYAGGGLSLPKEKELASMYLAGAEYLESRGYMQYEISNYARMGFMCRHNLAYWEGEEYLGLGPAAVSTIGDKRWTNAADLGEWQKAVTDGIPASSAEDLNEEAKAREMLMLRLRMNKGLPLKDWRQRIGRSAASACEPLIAVLQKNGLAAVRSGHLRLTRPGMLVSDTILSHFFARLEEG